MNHDVSEYLEPYGAQAYFCCGQQELELEPQQLEQTARPAASSQGIFITTKPVKAYRVL